MFAVVFGMVLFAAAIADARPYQLLWNPNSDGGVTQGYRVYQDNSAVCDPDLGSDAGLATSFPLNLTPGGTYDFYVCAYDGSGEFGPPSDVLHFIVPNTAPVLTNPGTQFNAPGNVVSVPLVATDADLDGLIFTSVTGLPPNLTANASGQITGTLTAGSAGVYTVTATVSDGGAQDVEVFSWRVIAFAASPTAVLSLGNVAAIIGSAPGGVNDYVTLAVAGTANSVFVAKQYLNGLPVPPGAPITDAVLSFAIGGGSGNYELRFFRNNTTTLFAMAPVTVTANQAPQVTAIGNRSDQSGVGVNLPVVATDPDGSYANAVLSASPAGYWKLNEASGTSATDTTGNGHTGAYTNGPTLGVAGAVGGGTAVQFDGVNDHVVVTGMPAMTQGTLEAWVYSTSIATDQVLISSGSFNYVRIVGSKAYASLAVNGVQRDFIGTTTLLANTWYHLAVTFDGATIKLYVNGVLNGSLAAAGSLTWPAASTVNLGRYIGGSNYFVGRLDEVAIYTTALTAAQVLAHAESRTLSYSATNLPPGVTINAATGAISGTPNTPGVYSVTVTVSDGATSTPIAFTWTVTSNQPPQVTPISNRTDGAGQAVSLPVTATDPDGSYANAVLSASPAGYWKLNEASGTSAFDASSNGHAGTYTNGPTLGVAGAVAGDTAAQFDGTNDHVVVTGMPAMTQGTLETWVNSTSIATDQVLVSSGSFNYLRIVGSKAYASLAVNGVQRDFIGATTLLANTWYHLAVTYDGATIRLYVNGVLDGSMSSAGSLTWPAASTVNLGRYIGGSNYFVGRLDEVAIYSTALTAAQVLAHAESRTLSYSATNLPPGVTINAATGAISGTPNTPGVYSVIVTVSDGATSTPIAFTWTIS